MWDLNNGGQLLHLIRGAHDGAITAIEWVPGQALLITSGEDNSVKVGCLVLHANQLLNTLTDSNGSLILPRHSRAYSSFAPGINHLLILSDITVKMENNC